MVIQFANYVENQLQMTTLKTKNTLHTPSNLPHRFQVDMILQKKPAHLTPLMRLYLIRDAIAQYHADTKMEVLQDTARELYMKVDYLVNKVVVKGSSITDKEMMLANEIYESLFDGSISNLKSYFATWHTNNPLAHTLME